MGPLELVDQWSGRGMNMADAASARWDRLLVAVDWYGNLGLALLLCAFFLSGLVWLYFVGRSRSGAADAQLGLKVVLHGTATVCYFLLLFGLSLILTEVHWYEGAPRFNLYLSGLSLAGMGGLGWLLHGLVLRFATNDPLWPGVGRACRIGQYTVHVVVLLAAGIQLVFLPDEAKPLNRTQYLQTSLWMQLCWATLVVWGTSWLGHLLYLRWEAGQAEPPSSELSWTTRDN